MTSTRLIWRIAIRPLATLAFLSAALMVRLAVGLDPLLAVLVAALFLFVPFILILRNRYADKSRRRNAMLEALAEPIWARVLSEWLGLTVVVVGVVFLTRDDPLNLWTLASVMAKIYLIAAPLLVACFVWLAISERRNVMAALARETAGEQPPR